MLPPYLELTVYFFTLLKANAVQSEVNVTMLRRITQIADSNGSSVMYWIEFSDISPITEIDNRAIMICALINSLRRSVAFFFDILLNIFVINLLK